MDRARGRIRIRRGPSTQPSTQPSNQSQVGSDPVDMMIPRPPNSNEAPGTYSTARSTVGIASQLVARTFPPASSFISPSQPAAAMSGSSPRKRAKPHETTYDGAADDDAHSAHSKGGHSLRKRARIDYTQEQVDDNLPSLHSSREVIPKSAVSPGTRSRKRRGGQDDSEEDSDTPHSHQKRRREKSPPSQRRKSLVRKSAADGSTGESSSFAEKPYENEVRDTILVGVSMDGAQDSPDDGQLSLRDTSHSAPASSDAARLEAVQQAVTASSPGQQSNQYGVIIGPELDAASKGKAVQNEPLSPIDKIESVEASKAADAREKPDTERTEAFDSPEKGVTPLDVDADIRPSELAKDVSSNSADIEISDAQHFRSETNPVGETQPQVSVERQPESASLDVENESLEPHIHDKATPTKSNGQSEMNDPDVPVPDTPKATSENQAVTSPERLDRNVQSSLPTPSSAPLADLGSLRKDRLSRIRRARSEKPRRLGPLNKIYESARAVSRHTHMGLTPYHFDEEDELLPKPWTEWVNPEGQQPAAVSTPLTPTTTPSGAAQQFSWNGEKPLKHSELSQLYQQDSARRVREKEGPISLVDFYNQCCRRHQECKKEAAARVTPQSEGGVPTTKNGRAKGKRAPKARASRKRPQAVVSRQATAAPSPEAVENDGQEAAPDDQVSELEDDPNEPYEITRVPKTQYAFPKLRHSSEFTKLLEAPEKLDDAELYNTLAAAAAALDAWQQEYTELKKITDDSENAKRRQTSDVFLVNWEKKVGELESNWRINYEEAVKSDPTPFEVRGARAPKPFCDDKLLERQRVNDRIQAQAWGFQHNNHPSAVGKQNPWDQRLETTDSRLRERKPTQRAADLAEENVIEGKRVRKPRLLSDQSKEPSRANTPALPAARRGKRNVNSAKPAQDEDGKDDSKQESRDPVQPAPSAEPLATADGGLDVPESRPTTSSSTKSHAAVDTAEPAYGLRGRKRKNLADVNDSEIETRSKRRTRQPVLQSPSPALEQTSEENSAQGPVQNHAGFSDVSELPKKTGKRIPFKLPGTSGARHGQLASGLVAPPNLGTAGSGPVPLAPAPHQQHTVPPSPASFMASFKAAPQVPNGNGPRKHTGPTKIKIINGPSSATSSRAVTPATPAMATAGGSGLQPIAQGPPTARTGPSVGPSSLVGGFGQQQDDPEKPYAEMSKSEKMSYSMRRRWANGEMKGAVEKRKSTLAKKAEAKAANTTTTTTNTTTSNVGGGKNKGSKTTNGSSADSSAGVSPAPSPFPVLAPVYPVPQQHLHSYDFDGYKPNNAPPPPPGYGAYFPSMPGPGPDHGWGA